MASRVPRNISARHLEVLELMAEGLTNAEIGGQLYLGPNTIKSHARALFQLLGAKDRAQAVALGFRRGLLGDRPRTAVLDPVAPSERHVVSCAALRPPKCDCRLGGRPYSAEAS